MRIDHGQVVQVERIAAPADHHGIARAGKFGADVVFHFDLVAIGKNHDARLLLVLVGDEQLADDRIDLARPAQDQGVVLFDDLGSTLAQLGETRIQPRGDGADQHADDENAADGDDQHQQAQPPALVSREGPGIHGVHQALPAALHHVEPGLGVGGVGGDMENHQDRGGDQHDRQRNQRQPANDGDGALGKRVFESIAQLIAPAGNRIGHEDG
jgi:hypothetical protein